MDFKKLLKQKMEAQAALVTLAIAEGRGMNDEERQSFEALEVEIKNLEATIAAQKVIDERAAAQTAAVNEPVFPSVQVKEKKWKSMGEMLQAVKSAAGPGGVIDGRLLHGVNGAATGMNEIINSDGGFLVDTDMVQELLQLTHDVGQVYSRARTIPIGPNSNGIAVNGVNETSRANGSRWGGVQAYWSGEAQTVTATQPKFKKLELKLDKLMALCYATDELLTDATALEAVIRQAFAEEMAFKLDDAVLNGSGAGVPLGILNSKALVTVGKESGQAAATITHNNILQMYNHCWSRSRANSVWFINQEIEPQLETMTIGIGTGGEVSPYAKEYIQFGTIKGKPVIPVEQCAALGSKGDIILADMSQYMMIDKGGITPATSVHVRFLYDEQVFRFTYRTNGMPIWQVPLQPYKGTLVMSPFVALEAR